MKIIQFLTPEQNRQAMEMTLKEDERIVCVNATVVMDSKGRLSYFRNDKPVFFIGKEDK